LTVLHSFPTRRSSDLEHDHDHGGANPHIWLSPPLAIHQVKAIRDALVEIDPGNASHYRRSSQAYIDSLLALDNEITLEITGWLQDRKSTRLNSSHVKI